jgi:flavocytochrome c
VRYFNSSGNSSKATSGINGSETKTQAAQGIKDTHDIFTQDVLRGGSKKPEMAKVLCTNSGPSVDWLMDKFDLDLSLIARLGGHSMPRTHRGKERFPGMTITFALMQMAEGVQEKDADRCRIINKARATKLISDKDGNVIGVEYEKGGKTYKEFGPVILCTGGFGADFTSDSLLAKYRPDLMHLPTTNGEHCTGDGIKMGEAVGGKTIDLEWVQVHPTGLVKPDDADAKVKLLAAEALRGEGGILLDNEGRRFCNELGRRDYVTGEMWKAKKAPYRLVLNSKAANTIHWHCVHYKGRGIMKQYDSGADLAKDMGVSPSVLEATFNDYNTIAEKAEKDPEGGPYDAYPSGKSWDKYGKKFFHNYPFSMNDVFHVSIVTPVIHYCMGGLEIDGIGGVVGKDGKAIPGVYAAGEVSGGVHGNNRLGGNALLECVVFGRLSGKAAAEYAYGKEGIKMTDFKEIAAHLAPVRKPAATVALTMEEVAKHDQMDDCWVVVNGQVLDVTSFLPQHPGGEPVILAFAGRDASAEFNYIHPANVIEKYAPDSVLGPLHVAAPVMATPKQDGEYTLEEVAKHNTKGDCWVVVNGQVLDVTSFLPDHPGGELAILTFAGKDASAEFNMIHPANVVEKYAPKSIIGKLYTGASSAAPAAPVGGLTQPLLAAPVAPAGGGAIATEHWWGEARNTSADFGVFGPSVSSFLATIYDLIILFMVEIFKTIFFVKNWTVPHDKSGLTRSAVFLIVFVLIHGLGNLHVYAGPDAFNGYAYFLNRPVPWGTLFLPVELYLLAAGILHVLVATIRTVKFKKVSMLTDSAQRGQLTLAITGFFLLAFLVIHLAQFRFIQNAPEYTFRVKWMYPFFCDRDNTECEIANFKDLYKLELELFEDKRWVVFYLASVYFFITHMNEGFAKVVNASQIVARKHKGMARFIGLCLAYFIGLLYFSYPIFCYLFPVKDWDAYNKEHMTSWAKVHP